MSALLSYFYDIHGIRYGSVSMSHVRYVICISGIAATVSDGVNVLSLCTTYMT
jgi:hypothetical protein